jgi:hypothetical protein
MEFVVAMHVSLALYLLYIFDDDLRSHSQEANIYVSESDAGVSHKIVLGAGRQAYLVCIEGGLTIGAPDGEVTLDQRDAVELVAPKKGAGALRVLVCVLLVHRFQSIARLVHVTLAA